MDFPASLLPYREALQALVKPSATFEPLPASAIIDPTASRLGGTPFTPMYTDWPSSMIPDGHVTRKRPQAFIGQFNFREIVTAVPELQGVLPSEGLFQLFYDTEEGPWGTYPADFNFISTAWYPDIEELRHVPLEAPPFSYPERQFGLKFSYRPSYPELFQFPDDFELPEDLEDLYLDWAGQSCNHQLAGYSTAIQNDVIEELENSGAGDGPWKILLQIDSDEKMNLMWGNTGTLYLGVQTEDLATADLSQARLIMQCC